MRLEHPKLKQRDICRLTGTSDSTLKWIRKDLNVSSPYRYNNKEKHIVNLSDNEILLLAKKLEEENDIILKQEKLNMLNEYVANKGKKAKQPQEMKDSKKITLQDLKKEVRQARVKEKKVLKEENNISDKSKKCSITN